MSVTIEIILIGGGGHALSCINVLNRQGIYRAIGILDREMSTGETIGGIPIIGTDDDRAQWIDSGRAFHLAIGHLQGRSRVRKTIYEAYRSNGAVFPTIIDPDSSVSEAAAIGKGTIVMPGARINFGAHIGENVILNTGAIVEHGAVVGDHTHVSTAAVINGDCSIGENCLIGSGAILRNGIDICSGTTVGMGAVVTKSIIVPGTYFGNPARKISS